MDPELTLRPSTDADLAFLRRVYASSRADELALTGWDEAQCEAFIDQQFDAQHRYYREHYALAAFDLILADGEPVGRLYVDRRDGDIRIVDIALLAEYRGGGLGTRLLRDLIDESETAGVSLSIHVEQFNPALRLYRRLGFDYVEQRGVYFLMRRPPRAYASAAGQWTAVGDLT